jgi:hypothetical protein
MRGTESGLHADMDREREAAQKLCDAFYNSETGIRGDTVTKSRERNRPNNVAVGSCEHLLFIALTSSVDRQRKAFVLWDQAQKARESQKECYLFDPSEVLQSEFSKVSDDLRRLKISQKHGPDARAWYTICETLVIKWHGDLTNFLESSKYHAPTVLDRLIRDHHWSAREGRETTDYPQLRGPKIARMFLRLLRDWTPIELTNMDEISIPTDVNVLRATLCAGVLRGNYAGNVDRPFQDVRTIWHEATQGLTSTSTGKPMIGLDVDGPLWRVGGYWCSKRGNSHHLSPSPHDRPFAPGCVNGALTIRSNNCEVNT